MKFNRKQKTNQFKTNEHLYAIDGIKYQHRCLRKLYFFGNCKQTNRKSMKPVIESMEPNRKPLVFNMGIDACWNFNVFAMWFAHRTCVCNAHCHAAITVVQCNINYVMWFWGGWVCNYVRRIHAMTLRNLDPLTLTLKFHF